MDPIQEMQDLLIDDLDFIFEVESEQIESLFEIQPPASVRRAAAEAAAAVFIAFERGYRMNGETGE